MQQNEKPFKMTHTQFAQAIKRFADLHMLPMNHCANEGKRSIGEGYKLKKEGMMPGFPDCHFIRANEKYHGLYMELKVPPDKLSINQIICIDMLRAEGNFADVYYNLDDALDAICWFYGLER